MNLSNRFATGFTMPHHDRPDADSPYLEPYREAVEASGASFESLLWHSRDYQEKRFETIVAMADPTGRVIADLGCGRADLLAWMHAHKVAYARYVGVEAIPEMIRFCRARAADEKLPGAEFIEDDFATDPDAFKTLVNDHAVEQLVFSGSLNTFEEAQAMVVLERAWQAVASARGTLVFNFLSTHHPPGANPRPTPARRFDPSAMLNWALQRTRLVRLRHDYLDGHDATIAMSAHKSRS
jgi:SAM-dependent methyltransferase